jgi:phytoene dehydrogenase-like protein
MAQALIIGGGHNGLTTAFYLAKAGHAVTVLERRGVAGGCAVTEEFAPGFRAPLVNAFGPLRASVARDMGLASRVPFVRPDPRLVALAPDGRALVFATDVAKTAEAIQPLSPKDAVKYPEFASALQRFGDFLGGLLEMTPPAIDEPTASEMWELLKLGRRFRGLGRRDSFRLLRWGPMAAADLVSEWFETDVLQAAIAARGVFGTAQGPWSAGSGAVLLLNAAFDPAPGGSSVTVKGGGGALASAMAEAARTAGAQIRLNAPVARIMVRDGAVQGVTLEDGTEVPGTVVISNADPRHTFLTLVDPVELDPGFLTKVRNYRARGTVAKLHFALHALPSFRAVANPSDLHGRIMIAPSVDYLERAFDASKYGELPQEPYLDITIPTLTDSSLAPPGKHVLSVHVQFVPYRLSGGATLHDVREKLASIVLKTLEQYAPGIRSLVESTQVLMPIDLEDVYGLTGGQIYHGEPALDQLFTMRPLLGWAQYRTPIAGLYMCGAGTHPGGGITAASGHNAARAILKELTR